MANYIRVAFSLFVLACQPKMDRAIFLEIPDKMEVFFMDSFAVQKKLAVHKLYVPIDVSCVTCLDKFKELLIISEELQKYENI